MIGRTTLPRSVPLAWEQLKRTSLSRLDITPWQIFNWILNEAVASPDICWIKLSIPFPWAAVMMVTILELLPWTSKGIPSRCKTETISSRRMASSFIPTNCSSLITERRVRTTECKSLWILAVFVGELVCSSSPTKYLIRHLMWLVIVW